MSQQEQQQQPKGYKNTLKRKSIEDIWPIVAKKFLVRVDFNVPMDKKTGEITNDLRIRSALKTIDRIRLNGGIAILMSHLGRPEGAKTLDAKAEEGAPCPGYEAKLSLKPVAARLSELIKQDVVFIPDCLNGQEQVAKLKPGDVALLENVRFYKNEDGKDKEAGKKMSEILASYADYFVSDAFGTAHRNSVTMTGVPKAIGHAACGYLMKKELDYFAAALNQPARPCVAIVGGSKVSDKIQLLQSMLERIDEMLIGGAMAYTFMKAKGVKTGKSMVEGKIKTASGDEIEGVELAAQILKAAEEKGVKLYLPVDHVCNGEFKAVENPHVTSDENIPDDMMALDIGPKTTEIYSNVIKNAKTVIWNGPMGVFEMPCYSNGTFTVARVLADCTQDSSKKLLSIIGGGDSATAVEQCKQDSRVSHVSTGGGASLELLEGKDLPGVLVLDEAN